MLRIKKSERREAKKAVLLEFIKYLYIYMYKEREREREKEELKIRNYGVYFSSNRYMISGASRARMCVCTKSWDRGAI